AGHVFISERWNTAFALQRFLARTLHGTPYPDGFIIDGDAEEATAIPDIGATDLFILTFGLSVAWFHRTSGEVVLKPPKFSTKSALKKVLEDYEMRQTSVAENEGAILACIAEIRRFNPVAKIVVTLSPVPLYATVTGTPVIVDNTVSKSVLRVALNNVLAQMP